MTEQQIKEFMNEKICPKCFKKLKKKNPHMIDCAFRYNNDEHLCDKANRLKR